MLSTASVRPASVDRGT